MAGKDYYKILGVSRTASDKEIKQAFRKLARKYHPDVNPNNKEAETRFKEISEAHDVLNDKEKRRKYDQFGENWQYADQFTQAGAQGAPFESFDFSGFGGSGAHFRTETGDLGEIFGSLFGRQARRPRPQKGRDIEHPVEITLEEAYAGTSRLLSMEAEDTCPACKGTGITADTPCSQCRGVVLCRRSKKLRSRCLPALKRVPGSGLQAKVEPVMQADSPETFIWP